MHTLNISDSYESEGELTKKKSDSEHSINADDPVEEQGEKMGNSVHSDEKAMVEGEKFADLIGFIEGDDSELIDEKSRNEDAG